MMKSPQRLRIVVLSLRSSQARLHLLPSKSLSCHRQWIPQLPPRPKIPIRAAIQTKLSWCADTGGPRDGAAWRTSASSCTQKTRGEWQLQVTFPLRMARLQQQCPSAREEEAKGAPPRPSKLLSPNALPTCGALLTRGSPSVPGLSLHEQNWASASEKFFNWIMRCYDFQRAPLLQVPPCSLLSLTVGSEGEMVPAAKPE